jgi:hypothetical protein
MEDHLTVNTSKTIFLSMLEEHIKSSNNSLFSISLRTYKDHFSVTPNLLLPMNAFVYYRGRITELPSGIDVDGRCKMTFKGMFMYLTGIIFLLPTAVFIILKAIYAIIVGHNYPPVDHYKVLIIFLGYNIVIPFLCIFVKNRA